MVVEPEDMTNEELQRVLQDLQEKVTRLEFKLEGLQAEQDRLRRKVEQKW